MTSTSRTPGFTLIEFMISVALLAILVALGMPNFVNWINNTKTRTFAESLANGLRLAQSEATRRSHSVQLTITNDSSQGTLSPTPLASGLNWSIQTVPLLVTANGLEAPEFIEKSQVSGANAGITLSASAPTVVFNSIGRLSGQANAVKYDISNAHGDRPLRVTVSPAGQVRLCDPSMTLSSTTPTGC
jgi:type IV fimbrial biogenesis protein FimT